MADREVVPLDAVPPTAPLYARALLPRGASGSLPNRTVVVRDVVQDASRLAAYNRVCEFVLTDHVPATWLHVLAFPLHLELLAARDFPVSLATVVHAANSMTLHRPVSVTEKLTLGCEVSGARTHRRGVMLDLLATASVAGEEVWRGISHYLAMGAKLPGLSGAAESDPAEAAASSELPTAGMWRLPANLGRGYAAVSGDVNPIHLNPVAAKALGFPRAIIHGMWTHARILAAVQPRLPDAYSVDVRFLKPILLPSTVRFAAAQHDRGFDAAVTSRDGAKAFVSAEVR